ncbi:MAG: hypothetical protein FWF35_01755 [Elusimicrobia bacterium]|nr:hypothetical protein [Elusimicrobiota bacterium]
MKKTIFVLFTLFVCAGAYAQNADMKFSINKDWCSTRSKIDIHGGLLDGKFISCDKDSEQTCMEIAQDLEDLLKNAGAAQYLKRSDGNLYLDLPYDFQAVNRSQQENLNDKQQQENLLNAMKVYQAKKLAGIKQKTQYPFYYAVDIRADVYGQMWDTKCGNEDEKAGGLSYIFWLVNTDNDKNLKKGKETADAEGSDYTVALFTSPAIYIRNDRK